MDVQHSALGRFVSEHAADRDRLAAMTFVAVLVGGFFLTLLVMVLWRPAPLHVKVIGLLLFGGFVGLFVGATFYYVRRFWWRVGLYEEGLAFSRSSATEVIRWDDVQYVYQEFRIAEVFGVVLDPQTTVGAQPDWRTRIITATGNAFSIDNTFKDLERLTIAISRGALMSLRTRAASALARGESVPFGPIELSSTGITIQGGGRRWWDILSMPMRQALSETTLIGGSLSWDEVQSVQIEAATQGPQSFYQVVIRRTGQTSPWAVRRINDLPNFDLFTQLVEQLHRPIET